MKDLRNLAVKLAIIFILLWLRNINWRYTRQAGLVVAVGFGTLFLVKLAWLIFDAKVNWKRSHISRGINPGEL